jgi:hypothetical protein
MSERHRRGRQSSQDDRRGRYPDETYGGERGAGRSDADDRGRSQFYGDSERERYGRDFNRQPGGGFGRDDYNRGDQYRRDFGPEGYARDNRGERDWGGQKPGHARENYGRDDAGWSGRGEWGQRGSEGWERGRVGGGGFGSEFGSWQSGASFGFGPEESPERGFDDSDWAPNRPGRGRGTWAGDWSTGRTPDAPMSGGGGMGGSYYMREETRGGDNFRGRGPKDYKRSDDRIREEVCDRLTDDPNVDAAEVNIKVEGGEVTLTGTVPTREQKWRAESCIERITGVRDVINQLRVNRNDWGNVQSSQTGTSTSTGRSQRLGSPSQSTGVAADREK